MKKNDDFINKLGALAIASRLKNLNERLFQGVSRYYKEYDFDFEPRWFPIIYYLKLKKTSPVTQIAKAINQTHPAVIQVLNVLEKRNLIIRTQSGQDQRVQIVSLSDEGKKLVKKLNPLWDNIYISNKKLIDEYSPGLFKELLNLETGLKEYDIYERIKRDEVLRNAGKLKIVNYRARYFDDFYSMNKEWLEKLIGITNHDKIVLENPQKEILAKSGKIYIAKIKKEVIGTFTLFPLPNNHCELSKFTIREIYRKLNLGKVILKQAVDIARESNYSSILLLTHPKLADATKLYKNFGFVNIGKHNDITDKTGRKSVIMQMKLV